MKIIKTQRLGHTTLSFWGQCRQEKTKKILKKFIFKFLLWDQQFPLQKVIFFIR